MTQKQSLARALDFAERDADDSRESKFSARAAFVILWLEDMNWHNEAGAIARRVAAAPHLQAELDRLRCDKLRMVALQESASLLNQVFLWTFDPNEWRGTQGTTLVEELWELITAHA